MSAARVPLSRRAGAFVATFTRKRSERVLLGPSQAGPALHARGRRPFGRMFLPVLVVHGCSVDK